MAITFVNAGIDSATLIASGGAGTGYSVGGSGDLNPPLPAGIANGDILICVLSSRDNIASTIDTPAGWNLKVQTINGTTNTLSVWWKRVSDYTTETAPIITHGGTSGVCAAVVYAFRGCIDSGDPFNAAQAAAENEAASTTFTNAGVSPSVTNTMILYAFGSTDDNSWGYSSGPATTVHHLRNQNGQDNSVGLAYGVKATSGATGNLVLTQTALGGDAGQTWSGALAPSSYTTYSNTVTDTAASVDSNSASVVLLTDIVDTAAGVEAPTSIITCIGAVSDSAAAVDSTSSTFVPNGVVYTNTVEDLATVVESSTNQTVFINTLSDSANSADVATHYKINYVIFIDSTIAVEQPTANKILGNGVTDSIAAVEQPISNTILLNGTTDFTTILTSPALNTVSVHGILDLITSTDTGTANIGIPGNTYTNAVEDSCYASDSASSLNTLTNVVIESSTSVDEGVSLHTCMSSGADSIAVIDTTLNYYVAINNSVDAIILIDLAELPGLIIDLAHAVDSAVSMVVLINSIVDTFSTEEYKIL
jgi:hypothetical protein